MLIKCPECGNQISDKAASCPHCGCPRELYMKQYEIVEYDPERMTGKTEADTAAIEVAMEFYGELLVSGDGRVWNNGGQVVAEMRYK